MVICDYYLCDSCGNKTFYDAVLQYGDDYDSTNDYKPLPKDAGQIRVLCTECVKTKKILIIEKSSK